MTQIIVIDKSGKCKESKISTSTEIYKKCGFRKPDDFENHHTWTVKVGDQTLYITVWGKINGRAGMENKLDLPPPVDHTLFFGSIAISARTDKQSVEPDFGLKTAGWNKLYEALFGGFDDVDQDDDENEIDELDAIPDSMKTQDGYLKDGFVVGSDADSEEQEGTSDINENDSSDEDEDNTDRSDAEEGEDVDAKLDGLSECSEEEYVYSDED